MGDGTPLGDVEQRLSWRWLAAIFALALALRVVAVAQYEVAHPLAQQPVIDEASYDRWAREIASGDVVGREIFFQEPLYPYALGAVYALAGDEPATQRSVARYLQALLGALTAALCAALGARAFGKFPGVLAGVLLALHRPAIWFAALLLKPNLFLPVVCALVLLALGARTWRAWLGVGVLAGLGALLRGNVLVLLPLIALWPIARALLERTSKPAALLGLLAVVAGGALVLTPVALRNQQVGGRFVLTTSGAGTNFYGGNNLDNPYGVATEFDWVRGVPEHEADDWRREASRRAGRELDATETSSFWLAAALQSMRAYPWEHARILWSKLRLTLGDYEVPDNHFLEWDARFVPLLQIALPGFGESGTVALAGAFAFALWWIVGRSDVRERRAALQLGAFASLYLATIVLTVTSERVRLALVPLLLPFAGFFVVAALSSLRALWVLLPSAAIAVLLVFVPVLPASEREQDFDEREYNLAVRTLAEGRLAAATPLVEGLLERRGATPSVQVLAAELDWREARAELERRGGIGRRIPEDLAERVESALRRLEGVSRRGNAQERFRAGFLTGAIHQYFGHWNEAEAAYRSALAFDAEDRDLRRRLAVVIAERAMLERAPEARSARLGEAITLLEALIAEHGDAELESLLANVRAQL